MRAAILLLLVACTGAPATPRVAPGVTYEVRLPDARHATKTDLANFVWPRILPPETATPDSEACAWWTGEYAGYDYAKRGLASGELGWGAVHLTTTEVGFDGASLTPLEGGTVPRAQRDLLTILPLSRALADARRRLDAWFEACGSVRRDRPVLIVDKEIPNEALSLALESLSVHRFGQAAMLVADRDPGERKPVDPGAPGEFVVVRQLGTSVHAMSITGERRAFGTIDQFESLVATAVGGEKYGCTLLAPQSLGRWEILAALLDAAQGFGSRRQLIAPVPSASPRQVEFSTIRRPTESLGLENTAGVFWVDLPNWSSASGEWLTTCDREGGFAGARVTVPEPLRMALRSPLTEGLVRIDPTLNRPAMDPPEPVYWGPIDLGEPGARPENVRVLEAELAACVEAAREAGDAPAQIKVRVEIQSDGKVRHMDVQSPVPEHPVHTCAMQAFNAMPDFAPLGENRFAAIVWPIAIAPIEGTTAP